MNQKFWFFSLSAKSKEEVLGENVEWMERGLQRKELLYWKSIW
jgi:hypothetical protein